MHTIIDIGFRTQYSSISHITDYNKFVFAYIVVTITLFVV
jgi:hypothetical protein